MIQQSAVLAEDEALFEKKGIRAVGVNHPYTALGQAVVKDSVKSIKNCPKTIDINVLRNESRARTRLIKALEVLDDIIPQPVGQSKDHDRFVFWCEVAEIDVDWISRNIKTLAQERPILMKVWEAHNGP